MWHPDSPSWRAPSRTTYEGSLPNAVAPAPVQRATCTSREVWFDRLEKKSELEEALLDAVCDLQPNSRLSCQIKVTEELDGLVVRLPVKQV